MFVFLPLEEMECVEARREKVPEEMHSRMLMTEGGIGKTKKFEANAKEQQSEASGQAEGKPPKHACQCNLLGMEGFTLGMVEATPYCMAAGVLTTPSLTTHQWSLPVPLTPMATLRFYLTERTPEAWLTEVKDFLEATVLVSGRANFFLLSILSGSEKGSVISSLEILLTQWIISIIKHFVLITARQLCGT